MSTSRVQLALNVADLAAATRFYEKLFGVAPTKQREGYANFAVADPPLKLVLFEDPNAASPLNHLGVELATADDVAAAARRVAAAGLEHRVSEQERCCHAIQDKVWVTAPDVPLNAWELYTVLADDPAQSSACDHTVCCTGPEAAPAAATGSEAGPCCS
ncbi:MAG: ArsI/CadI family heavy metal resistance metalloenzyme [Acidimicrobiales bacterium]